MLKNKLLSAMGGVEANYIEDVFSTYLYTGNGSTQTITNGVDLAGEGGLVWIKDRSLGTRGHVLYDTARGGDYLLTPSGSDALTATNGSTFAVSSGITFNSTGFSLGTDSAYSVNNFYATSNYASWTFRKAEKFFDVVTYTGNGANRTIAHSLGSAPGCIIVKRTDFIGGWVVYHRSLAIPAQNSIFLNSTNAETGVGYWNSTSPTSTSFSLGTDGLVNGSGATYVAYLFAHNAGGFGPSQSDNVISCGSYVADGTDKTITLGYEPQWVMVKRATDIGDWIILDTQRGWSTGTESYLKPNTSGAEDTGNTDGNPTSTGFLIQGTGNLGVAYAGSNQTMLYVAIRKNMKS